MGSKTQIIITAIDNDSAISRKDFIFHYASSFFHMGSSRFQYAYQYDLSSLVCLKHSCSTFLRLPCIHSQITLALSESSSTIIVIVTATIAASGIKIINSLFLLFIGIWCKFTTITL